MWAAEWRCLRHTTQCRWSRWAECSRAAAESVRVKGKLNFSRTCKTPHIGFHLLCSTHLVLNGTKSDIELKSHGRHEAGRAVAAAYYVGPLFGSAGFLVRGSCGLGRDGRGNSGQALLQNGSWGRSHRQECVDGWVLNQEILTGLYMSHLTESSLQIKLVLFKGFFCCPFYVKAH